MSRRPRKPPPDANDVTHVAVQRIGLRSDFVGTRQQLLGVAKRVGESEVLWHFIIDRTGDLFRGRHLRMPAYSVSSPANTTLSVGIVMSDPQSMTETQLATLRALLVTLSILYEQSSIQIVNQIGD